MAWRLAGEFFETCSCDVLCPCILTNATAMPTQGHCDAVLAFRVDDGSADGIDLSGLTAVLALQTDGPMADGRGRRAVYIDSNADDRQRQALEGIIAGQAGGPLGAISALVPEYLGAKTARISFSMEGDERRLIVEGIGEQSITALRGPSDVLYLTNTMHPANSTVALAQAGATARFTDGPFDFDNAGKNGHFAPFRWQV